MTTIEETPDDPLVREEEAAAAREAGSIGGRAPEYEDEEGDPVERGGSCADRGRRGRRGGLRDRGERPPRGRQPRREPLRPEHRDFGDEESAGDGDAVSGEADEIDVTETVRDPEAGPGEDPGEGPGISHDR